MLEQWHILQMLHCNVAYFAKKQKNGNIILAAVVGTVAYIADIALQYRIKKWKYNISSS